MDTVHRETAPPAATDAADTFPRLLLGHARDRAGRTAIREKDLGIWLSWTWREVAEEVRAIACGLAAIGFGRGRTLAVIGDNRPRLYWTMMAAQALGGIAVPLYQDAVADEMLFVLENAGITLAVVEDQEQVDKLLELRPRFPGLEHIVYDDPRGLRNYPDAPLLSFEDLLRRGHDHDRDHPGFFEAEVAKGHADDIAVMLYTSGTTGNPKGVCHTHASLIAAARGDVEFDGFGPSDEVLSYLPMAWVGDHLFSYAQALVAGFCVNCPESSETVMTDMREIGPTYYFAPPRVFENLLTQVMIRMDDAAPLKRRMFHYFMAVARRCGATLLDGRRAEVPLHDRILYAIGRFLVYGPLCNVLGMSRIRVAYTGGAAIGPDLFDFYRSIGINLKQLYGQTETAVYVCKQPNGEVKLDTVGKPLPGVQVRIADSGEVQVRTPGMLKEYYRRPDATAESISPDGWFLTGDAGFFDDDGHLRIIDRAKDVGRLEDGTLFAPQYIENKLKFFPHVKEAVAFGDHRAACCAFVNIDLGSVGNWAERQGIAYSGYTDLAQKDAVYALIQECVEKVNEDLAREPHLAGSQIRRFLILHKELDADDGELTRTRKLRRGFIAERYRQLVDALYSDATHCEVEAHVKFEDGRSGVVRADVKIRDARCLPAGPVHRQAA
ncbi:MAG: AMP-binding protein [Betaproteobacteria bacterium]|nr:AMP-binding protein [Betaproteobacteria bacterium]